VKFKIEGGVILNYSLGLDIGITSVGWAVINEDKKRIEDLGVRIFPAAETPKNQKSLSAPRREARGRRRTLRRKKWRLLKIRELIIEREIISKNDLEYLGSEVHNSSVWELRSRALDEILSGKEFSRVLINLAKRRGFKSNKREEDTKEDGVIKEAISENRKLMENRNYRTVGEMIYKDPIEYGDKSIFFYKKRNTTGDYKGVVTRAMMIDEVKKIFEVQRSLGNEKASEEIEKIYLGYYTQQYPYSSREQLIKKVGYCTFEKDEKRAVKASYAFEYFNFLQTLNNERIGCLSEFNKFDDEQRKIIIKEMKKKKKLTYSNVRKLLKLETNIFFKSLRNNEKESKVFAEMKFFKQIEKALETNTFEQLSEKQIDQIAEELTYCKEYDELSLYLSELKFLNDDEIKNLSNIRPVKVGHLSYKALYNIIPFMENGDRYDEACKACGYTIKKNKTKKSKKLPKIDQNTIRNPVVLRALTQSRKVVNAIIDKYGTPSSIHIELAREVAKSPKERKNIEKMQNENRKRNENIIKEIKEIYNREPKPIEIVKYKLWKSQEHRCAYSLKAIEADRVLENGYTEIDHIIPYSKSLDDSYNNKVLVLTKENQQKGNKIPYDYIGNDEKSWNKFSVWVESNNEMSFRKKQNLLKMNYSSREEKGMISRNLVDTRYITSYFYNFIKDNLILDTIDGKKGVIAINGMVTAYLRKQWGLSKDRKKDDRHHALDAAVVAVASDRMIQEITRAKKYNEIELKREKTPTPWECFREELIARLSDNPRYEIEHRNWENYRDVDLEEIEPLFISRKPNRKVTGPAHEETIKSSKLGEGKIIKRIKIQEFKKSYLDKLAGNDPLLKRALEKRLEEIPEPKKAFSKPIYKPKKNGEKGPLIKSVRIIETQNSGVKVQKGIASNGDMIRADIFEKEDKYYIVPLYVADTVKEKLPNRAAPIKATQSNKNIMDDRFEFKFSLQKNDLVYIYAKKGINLEIDGRLIEVKELFGYYKKIHATNDRIIIGAHDSSWEKEIGIKQVDEIKKYDVTVLGERHEVKKEARKKFVKK
jgi:CRISPR-associated endonuclease Csn1